MGIQLKRLHSPDLPEGDIPENPTDCAVLVQAMIGPVDGPGEESFDFLVVTPDALKRLAPRWGRGLLVLPAFSWDQVRRHVERLVAQCGDDSWANATQRLSRFADWEFESYTAK